MTRPPFLETGDAFLCCWQTLFLRRTVTYQGYETRPVINERAFREEREKEESNRTRVERSPLRNSTQPRRCSS